MTPVCLICVILTSEDTDEGRQWRMELCAACFKLKSGGQAVLCCTLIVISGPWALLMKQDFQHAKKVFLHLICAVHAAQYNPKGMVILLNNVTDRPHLFGCLCKKN